MSEILGYDVNGRPLRAGDWAKYIGPTGAPYMRRRHAWIATTPIKVVGPAERWAERAAGEPVVMIEGPNSLHVTCAHIRRIDDRTDHQPSEHTFDSLMDHLKSGVPA